MFPLFRTDHLHFAVSVLSLHLCSNVCVFELVLLPAQECWTAVCPCLARFPLSPLCLTFPAHMTHISSKTACICTDLCTFARPPAARRFSFLFVHRHSDSSLPSSCRLQRYKHDPSGDVLIYGRCRRWDLFAFLRALLRIIEVFYKICSVSL